MICKTQGEVPTNSDRLSENLNSSSGRENQDNTLVSPIGTVRTFE